MTKENKTKRFYKEGQIIWAIQLKKEVEVKSVNRKDLTITVLEKKGSEVIEHTFPLWSVDVLKYNAKKRLEEKKTGVVTQGQLSVIDMKPEGFDELVSLVKSIMFPEVRFGKVRDSAVIPSKRNEDAGYDIYASLDNHKAEDGHFEIECPVLATTLVPTGLATALPDTHFIDLKHERGSTGVQSMSVLAGVIDSGFRNEMFIALTPLRKSVIITSRVGKVEETDTHILYPYSKAICQGTIDLVPKATIIEDTYENILKIESERGLTMLGESGK